MCTHSLWMGWRKRGSKLIQVQWGWSSRQESRSSQPEKTWNGRFYIWNYGSYVCFWYKKVKICQFQILDFHQKSSMVITSLLYVSFFPSFYSCMAKMEHEMYLFKFWTIFWQLYQHHESSLHLFSEQ